MVGEETMESDLNSEVMCEIMEGLGDNDDMKDGDVVVRGTCHRGCGVMARGESGSGGISLFGLLNAIDGVASQEGRVLIMTTNTPESLDGALVRPGCVDMQVEFTNVTRLQT